MDDKVITKMLSRKALALFVCCKCGEKFETELKLFNHDNHSHKIWGCSDCPSTFIGRIRLQKHVEKIHLTEKKKRIQIRYCPSCKQIVHCSRCDVVGYSAG